jgi:hypothetical protein
LRPGLVDHFEIDAASDLAAIHAAYKQGWNDALEEAQAFVETRTAALRERLQHRAATLGNKRFEAGTEDAGYRAAGALGAWRLREALPPRIAVDDRGHYWRDYLDHYSMPPVSDDNEPVEVVAYYVRLEGKRIEAEAEQVAAQPAPAAAYIPVQCPNCQHVRVAPCPYCGDEAFLHLPEAEATQPAPLDVDLLAKAMELARDDADDAEVIARHYARLRGDERG